MEAVLKAAVGIRSCSTHPIQGVRTKSVHVHVGSNSFLVLLSLLTLFPFCPPSLMGKTWFETTIHTKEKEKLQRKLLILFLWI